MPGLEVRARAAVESRKVCIHAMQTAGAASLSHPRADIYTYDVQPLGLVICNAHMHLCIFVRPKRVPIKGDKHAVRETTIKAVVKRQIFDLGSKSAR